MSPGPPLQPLDKLASRDLLPFPRLLLLREHELAVDLKTRDFGLTLTKKMRRLAIRFALSGNVADGPLAVIEEPSPRADSVDGPRMVLEISLSSIKILNLRY